MLTIYFWLNPFLLWLLPILGKWIPGIRDSLKQREGLRERWEKAAIPPGGAWFHVASVGELEQIRPVLEWFSYSQPKLPLVLTYFSGAVPRLVKDFSFVSYADFLPLDRFEDMNLLIDKICPKVLVLNRYDLWPFHLKAARGRGVPMVLINASTPPSGLWGMLGIWLRMDLFHWISAWTFVDSTAALAWEPLLVEGIPGLVTGNPRVDRVLSRAEQAARSGKSKDKLQYWTKQKWCLVGGSTWSDDEDVLIATFLELQKKDSRQSMILVPHEPFDDHLLELTKKLNRAQISHCKYSALQAGATSEASVLIVDSRGLLSELYLEGDVAYVGGGFGVHVHSIIEPVAHGKPVAYGPHCHRSPEAEILGETAAGMRLANKNATKSFATWIHEDLRLNPMEWDRAQEAIRVFVQVHRGAGERVGEFVLAVMLHKKF